MKQYNEMKAMHPDAVLLFRVGDFYETFSTDAVRASSILGITLTKRANGSASYVELAGFPHHALDTYLPKLVRAGLRVAICEQLEDPKKTKKIVKRGIVELVTPGVSFNDNLLENRENNFLACIHFEKKNAGIAFLDVSTGEFFTAEGDFEYIDKLLGNFQPKEVLFQRGKEKIFKEHFGGKYYTFTMEDWVFTESAANDKLLSHFETSSMKGYGVQNLREGIIASGAILHYLDITKHNNVGHINHLARIEEEKYVWLDKFTVRNLELFGSMNDGAANLAQVMDKTHSPMGARLLKRWIALPLNDPGKINNRLEVVKYFYANEDNTLDYEDEICQIGDLERIVSKVAVGRISPREIVQLKKSLNAIPKLRELCLNSGNDNLMKIGEQLNPCDNIRKRIEREIVAEPPVMLSKGEVICNGISEDLDELRKIAYSGKDYLLQMQKREMERTGITSLKIGFNNVFGYYIEVRNTHKDKVPPEWIRKQTLVSAERYITEELKIYEEKILGAEDKISAIEVNLYNDLVLSISDYISSIQLNASMVARLDCLSSFARLAKDNKYVCPHVNDSKIIDIKQGRHPVIEKQLNIDQEYVANDVYLDNDTQQVMMITGPNMSGKSALCLQSPLI